MAALAALSLPLQAVAPLDAAADGISGSRPTTDRARYLDLAADGIATSRRRWWNAGARWFNSRLTNNDPRPLASIWSIVPLFEAIDGLAIAKPTKKNLDAVRWFASAAERYWNPDVQPGGAFAPYPGTRGAAADVWFDDNGWWGIAFVDAYRATGDRRYLDHAARASDFITASGWDGDRGVWWNTDRTHHSIESWASATALAAELYRHTGQARYRRLAEGHIRWGKRHARHSARGLYATERQPVMSYVQGLLIGAHTALCDRGHASACREARRIAQAALEKWQGRSPDHAPQYDTILMRYLVQLSEEDGDPTWYDWAARVAERAERQARDDGLWLRFWDGSKPPPKTDGRARHYDGMIRTHAATVALFAWVGAVRRPPGPARELPRAGSSGPGGPP